MIPEIWNTQCAWCGSPMGVHKECVEMALTHRGDDGPILVCALCGEGNTVKSKKWDGAQLAWIARTEQIQMTAMRNGLNSSNAAPYLKRRLN